jgi:hypothetical protein
MHHAENNSAPTVSYLLEHSHGTCELWIKRSDAAELTTYEPLKLLRVSGKGTVLLKNEMIAEAILLEGWMADHFEVFTEGRTSCD